MNTKAIIQMLASTQDDLGRRGYIAAISNQTADDVQVTIRNATTGLAIWTHWSFEDEFQASFINKIEEIAKYDNLMFAATETPVDNMRNEVVVAAANYAGLMQDNKQYIDNILAVARTIRKPCYAVRLIHYIDNTFPVNIHPMYSMRLSLLKQYCDFNRGIVCVEDGIQPAIAVVNLLTVESTDHPTVAHLNCMIAAQYDIIQTGAYMDSKCSYEDFCDKYAHILNR